MQLSCIPHREMWLSEVHGFNSISQLTHVLFPPAPTLVASDFQYFCHVKQYLNCEFDIVILNFKIKIVIL